MARKPKVVRMPAGLMAMGELLEPEDLESLDTEAARDIVASSEVNDAENEKDETTERA